MGQIIGITGGIASGKSSVSLYLQELGFTIVDADLASRAVVEPGEEAYHQLLLDIIRQQVGSTNLVLNGSPVKRLFVDGGFSRNAVYMNLLAMAFPQLEVYAASMAQATALGAALAIHKSWNKKRLPNTLIKLQYYAATQTVV